MNFPAPVSGRVSEATKTQVGEAVAKFGATESTIVRLALEAFVPGYIAGAFNPANADLLTQIGALVSQHPELKPALEEWLRRALRSRGTQAPAKTAA